MDIGTWKDAVFLERPNRFLALVELEGERVRAHVPDPGRLHELLIPGARVRLRAAPGWGRLTSWDLIGVACPEGWVNIDSRLPNSLFSEAVREGRLDDFPGITRIAPEYRFGDSVLDFLLEGRGPHCLVEVKGCTLVVDGVAQFPDAPTKRGSRHLAELARAREQGLRACVVFVVKHPGGRAFSANRDTDPLFADSLEHAVGYGVEVIPYFAPWEGQEIRLRSRLPFIRNV
ncbi:MAG: DNA/RNA nuclease SfsA [Actinobacteria bacterium]|nr:DNA/RNA nuclease SfsA [Actinomycetota bacterium]